MTNVSYVLCVEASRRWSVRSAPTLMLAAKLLCAGPPTPV